METDKTSAILYVFKLLEDYDIATKNGTKPKIDPYRDELYLINDNDVHIEISDNLRKTAIREWLQQRNIAPRGHTYSEERIISSEETTVKSNKCMSCRRDGRHSNRTLIETSIQLILCIIIIFMMLYMLSRIKKCLHIVNFY